MTFRTLICLVMFSVISSFNVFAQDEETSSTPIRDFPVHFVGVALDPETMDADQRLRDFFRGQLPSLKFENRDMEYKAAIDTLVQWKAYEKGPLMARVTPYVYVTAEMLGAELEILGTYVSNKTQETIYHSYLVVHRSTGLKDDDLDEFVKYLKSRKTPARFIYHSKFSTSSYFLPSLYFKKMGIFSTRKSGAQAGKHIYIHAEKPEGIQSSSELVRRVKKGEADLAAVWDGTKAKFENDPDLLFLKLPNGLPNDLLVVSRALRHMNPKLEEGLRNSLRVMKADAINIGDFNRWEDFNKTHNARRALASLRQLARVKPNKIPVEIRREFKDSWASGPELFEAARQAIRLSGNEFVLYDEDFHKHFDVLWTLRKTHDDSLIITSDFVDSGLEPQEFHVSFKKGDRESMVRSIGDKIDRKMHRIRYVWPFDNHTPRVLRDVDFNLDVGTGLKALKVTWRDLTSNDYVMGTPFDVTLTASDFHSFLLEGKGFPRNQETSTFDFDPLSETAYRVILVRPQEDTAEFKLATYALISLYSLATVFLLAAIIKGARKEKGMA